MVFLRIPATAFALFALVAITGCDRAATRESAAPPAPVLPAEHRFTIAVDGKPVRMRLAVSDGERSRGLMAVTHMPEDEGMLFLWDRPQRMSFFMRNTRIPLSIGYFDGAGVLREIYPMYPGIEDGVGSIASNLHYALEMNEGWFVRHGVKPGAQLDREALREALRARGFKPEQYVRGP